MNIDKNSLRARQWRRKRDRPATIFSQWYGRDSQLPNAPTLRRAAHLSDISLHGHGKSPAEVETHRTCEKYIRQ